jgi:hypothetical protein
MTWTGPGPPDGSEGQRRPAVSDGGADAVTDALS